MAEAKDGGQAFPRSSVCGRQATDVPGMTLRDYFAAAALTGMILSIDKSVPYEVDANFAYRVADAMLTARVKGGA